MLPRTYRTFSSERLVLKIESMEAIWVVPFTIPAFTMMWYAWQWRQAKQTRRVMRCLQTAVRQSRAA